MRLEPWLEPPDMLYSVEIRHRSQGEQWFGPWIFLEGHLYRDEDLARHSAERLTHKPSAQRGLRSDDVETETRVIPWSRGRAK